MPELAAHLERELAELNQRLDGSNRCVTCGHWRNDHAMDLVGEHFCEHDGPDECKCENYVGVMPPSYAELVLTLRGAAAALAACAREEAKWWLEKAGRDGHFWIVSPIHKHPEDCRCEAHERIAALERAVGEKA